MHASSFTIRFNKGRAHHADIVRVPQNCKSLRSSPPILPSVMIVRVACWVGRYRGRPRVRNVGETFVKPWLSERRDRAELMTGHEFAKFFLGRGYLCMRRPYMSYTISNPVLRRIAGECIVPASAARGGYRQSQLSAANIGTTFSNVMALRGLRIRRLRTSSRNHAMRGT